MLLIDAGNSRLKWSVNNAGEWSPISYASYTTSTRLVVTLKVIANIKPLSITMVHVLGNEFANAVHSFCERHAIVLTIINAQAGSYGIKNAYGDASKLGADRFVSLIAVHYQNKVAQDSAKKGHEGCDSIIISCGTAVTIDAINKQGKHLGGVILPGLQLWKEMLVNGTILLEQVDEENKGIFATSTGQGIIAGSLYGLAGAIDRVCNEMKQSLTAPIVVFLTGGCAETLRPYFYNTYKLSPNLVIEGLKIIIEMENA